MSNTHGIPKPIHALPPADRLPPKILQYDLVGIADPRSPRDRTTGGIVQPSSDIIKTGGIEMYKQADVDAALSVGSDGR